jgi:16S rRNA (cytosine1402-N4)-methyltransferase
LFIKLGEISKPYRVAKAIEDRQKSNPVKSTKELAALIEKTDGWQKKGFHPATQYFMALRLAVNQELESVERALQPLLHGLKPSGRLAVLTFHSLEDRIVKNVFKSATELGMPLFKNVLQATVEEQKANPRSRSAKLRIFERRDENQVEEATKPGMKKRRPKRQEVSPDVFRKNQTKD